MQFIQSAPIINASVCIKDEDPSPLPHSSQDPFPFVPESGLHSQSCFLCQLRLSLRSSLSASGPRRGVQLDGSPTERVSDPRDILDGICSSSKSGIAAAKVARRMVMLVLVVAVVARRPGRRSLLRPRLLFSRSLRMFGRRGFGQ